jgi:hypothetical protein
MTSKKYTGRAALLPLAVAVTLVSMDAHALSPVDCATVDLDLSDSKVTKSCEDGDVGSNMWHGTAQEMTAKGDGYFLWVRRVKAGFRSYVSIEDIGSIARDIAGDLVQDPSIIHAHATVLGYEVATFNGRLQKEPHRDAQCVVFSRYGGIKNPRGGFSGAPGYAHELIGTYCTGATLSDSTIERVLGELHSPVE